MNITTPKPTFDVSHANLVTDDVTTLSSSSSSSSSSLSSSPSSSPSLPQVMTSEESVTLNAAASVPPAGLYYYHVIYFSVAIVLGVPGNAIVVMAYSALKSKTSCDWYILYIGVLDLIVCLFRVPTHLAMETGHWQYHGTDALCKCVYWLSQSVISASVILFGFIAIDRYIKVCRPAVVISPSFSRNSIVLITLCSMAFAVPSLWMFANNAQGRCVLITSSLGFRLVKAYYTTLFAAFIIMFLVVVVCYASIIIKARKSQRIIKNHRKKSQTGGAVTNRTTWRTNRVGVHFQPDFEVDAGLLKMMPDFKREVVDKNESCSVESEKESLSVIATRLRNPMGKVSGDYCLWRIRPKPAKPAMVTPIQISQATDMTAASGLTKGAKIDVSPKLIPRPPTTGLDFNNGLSDIGTVGRSPGHDRGSMTASSTPQASGNTYPGPSASKHKVSPRSGACNDGNGGSSKPKHNTDPVPFQTKDSAKLSPAVSKESINSSSPDSEQNMRSGLLESENSVEVESPNAATADKQKFENILSAGNLTTLASEINSANPVTKHLPVDQQTTLYNPTETLGTCSEQTIIDQGNRISLYLTERPGQSQPQIHNNHLFVTDSTHTLKPERHSPIKLGQRRPSGSSDLVLQKSSSMDTNTNSQSCEPSTSVCTLRNEENESCSTVPVEADVTATLSATRSEQQTDIQSSLPAARSSRQGLSRPLRLALLLMTVTVVFVISWIPPYLAMIWYFYVGYTRPIPPLLMALRVYGPSGYVLNHFANPILYLAFSSSFRHTVRSLWRYVATRLGVLVEDLNEELTASNLQSASHKIQMRRRHPHGTFNITNTAQELGG